MELEPRAGVAVVLAFCTGVGCLRSPGEIFCGGARSWSIVLREWLQGVNFLPVLGEAP